MEFLRIDFNKLKSMPKRKENESKQSDSSVMNIASSPSQIVQNNFITVGDKSTGSVNHTPDIGN